MGFLGTPFPTLMADHSPLKQGRFQGLGGFLPQRQMVLFLFFLKPFLKFYFCGARSLLCAGSSLAAGQGFSGPRLLLLQSMGSRHVVSVAVVLGLRFPAACGPS